MARFFRRIGLALGVVGTIGIVLSLASYMDDPDLLSHFITTPDTGLLLSVGSLLLGLLIWRFTRKNVERYSKVYDVRKRFRNSAVTIPTHKKSNALLARAQSSQASHAPGYVKKLFNCAVAVAIVVVFIGLCRTLGGYLDEFVLWENVYSPLNMAQNAAIRKFHSRWGWDEVPGSALDGILRNMEENTDFADKAGLLRVLESKAQEYRRLQEQFNHFSSDDPQVVLFRTKAEKALVLGLFKQTEAFLQQSKDCNLKAAAMVDQNIRKKRLAAARDCAASAAAAKLRFNPGGYRKAASFYAEAADIARPADKETSIGYALLQSQTLQEIYMGFGDDAALAESIDLLRHLLAQTSRETHAHAWAGIQNSLGNAFMILDELEPNTPILEEAISAYHEALREFNRQHIPLEWAQVQHNLGNALSTRGRRESDMESLVQAFLAYREALGERTRERVPLKWAQTHKNIAVTLLTLNNLGNTHEALFDITCNLFHLEQAVFCATALLELFEKYNAPYYRQNTQRNLERLRSRLEEENAKAAAKHRHRAWFTQKYPIISGLTPPGLQLPLPGENTAAAP